MYNGKCILEYRKQSEIVSAAKQIYKQTRICISKTVDGEQALLAF
jgi:hypothetical protein